MSRDPLVTIQNLSFSYLGEKVLDNINLDICRGEFLGIIGPNGSGKTTLLKIILGLLKPQTGSVHINTQRISYIPQRVGANISHFPVSVSEVVGMGGATTATVLQALNDVDMADYKDRLIDQLSGGQQQRVFIARALASKPELLILDEPTTGVDVESQTKFYELLKNLNGKMGITLVLVSHDIEVVANEVNEIACLNCKLVCHGKPQEILKGDYVEKMYGKELRLIAHSH